LLQSAEATILNLYRPLNRGLRRSKKAASPSWMRSVISISGGFGAVLGGVAGVSFGQLAGRMEMSIAEADYLEKNRSSWQYGYDAPNVESWVFRWNGRILRNKLGITSGNLLDWGCGQGATAGFFQRIGFDAYGGRYCRWRLGKGQAAHSIGTVETDFPEAGYDPVFQSQLRRGRVDPVVLFSV
jgi:hypothetical protein